MAQLAEHHWLYGGGKEGANMSEKPKNNATEGLRIAFIVNICPHYRVKTFEALAQYFRLDYYFFSAGDEWYWEQKNGTRAGSFRYEYLPGINLLGTRLTPILARRLWRGKYDVFVKCIAGRFALPLTYCIARLRRRPIILWTGLWMTLQSPFHRLIFPLTRFIYRHVDAIVVYGEHVKRYLVTQGVEAERVFVAAHAVDNAIYSQPVSDDAIKSLRTKLSLTPEDRVILYLGRLEECKGLTYLVRALAELETKNARLVLVGEGSQRVLLQRQIKELGLTDRVRFLGYVPPEETLPYYALADVLVLPSISTPQGKEQWGLVVNEAMNQGVPVIATDVVGAVAGGLVQDGINGFVVPERDSSAIAGALGKIIESPDLRDQMSRQTRRIIAGWDNENMVLGFRRAVEYVTADTERQTALSVPAESNRKVG
jgi:glycosyltransferase involved in cell wall biosynthesis